MDSRDPLITLAYTRNGITSEYSDRTDLWTGETWTIIVRPDGSADGHYGELLESND